MPCPKCKGTNIGTHGKVWNKRLQKSVQRLYCRKCKVKFINRTLSYWAAKYGIEITKKIHKMYHSRRLVWRGKKWVRKQTSASEIARELNMNVHAVLKHIRKGGSVRKQYWRSKK